ncbi:MAG: hypothetical protein K6C95_11315 [Lachnospiraceae bacterium]|nr:hypothetical protein [Lachnospiraceae bacterium]
MHYKVVVFGVKDTSEVTIDHIRDNLCPVDLLVTIDPSVTMKNHIAGYKGLAGTTDRYGIPVFAAMSYSLRDELSEKFFSKNTFDIGIVVGWQRLIPKHVLGAFRIGVFGFHGNAGYLPFGRGRSPLNWSIILGDTRFHLNLFRYDEFADSPNIFATELFSINAHDDIRTAQYKNMICTNRLIDRLLTKYLNGEEIVINSDSMDFDSWFDKRTAADGRIDWHARTRDIYNLIRGVAAPFPGAFCTAADGNWREDLREYLAGSTDAPEPDRLKRVMIWQAQPFDEIIDFSAYAPGEIISIFDNRPIVRTVDGSLLIDRYESEIALKPGVLLY